MKHPWQIWTLYFLCLALALPALGWLSIKALEVDRSRAEALKQTEQARKLEAEARLEAEQARAAAELQDRVSRALYSMDWMLMPLLAEEIARPYFVYQPVYAIGEEGGKGSSRQQFVPSPLLRVPSQYVLLHFQIRPGEEWSSPQVPEAKWKETAFQYGAVEDHIAHSKAQLEKLKREVSREDLLAMLPDELLPLNTALASEISPPNSGPSQGDYGNYRVPRYEDVSVINDLGLSQLPQQTEVFQQSLLDDSFNQAENDDPFAQSQTQQSSQGNERNQPQQQVAANSQPQARGRIPQGRNADWDNRNQAYQSYAQSKVVEQRANLYPVSTPEPLASEGVSRPVWVKDQLLLARRVVQGNEVIIQGCWLNWRALRKTLLEQAADIEGADLLPVRAESEVQPARMLATLPVQFAADQPRVSLASFAPLSLNTEHANVSPIRLSLILAWTGLGLAALAVGITLRGVVALSERRGAFVSAVTHELRTPLTTFRMYAEMLAGGMVPSEQQRQRYLETLRVEADRLSHLVENVLSYAQLERGKPGSRRETMPVSQLLARMETRLADRAREAEMELVLEGDAADAEVATDPDAIEQILFNLVDNASKYAKAAQDNRIHLRAEQEPGYVVFRVSDHGPGISQQGSRKLFRPFSKSVDEAAVSAPGVGLGLALCRRLALALGGRLDYEPGGSGASFALRLPAKPS